MTHSRKYINNYMRLNVSALLLFICFCSQNSLASSNSSNVVEWSNTSENCTLSNYDQLTLQSACYYSDFSHNPFQIPVEFIITFNEPNEVDEKENSEDDEWKHLNTSFYYVVDSEYKSTYFSFAQFEQNVLKRPKISLVVLHHSWKSFLI